MSIRIFTFILTVIGASTGFAQTRDLHPVISKDDFRAAIYAQDFTRIEAAIESTQALFRDGKAPADDMRTLFENFATTNPQVINFTKTWIERSPQSPSAHAAQAWIFFKAGWIIRGTKRAKDTYPDAMDQHTMLHEKALFHAQTAYGFDPLFIPASDAIIMLGNTTNRRDLAYEVLEATMQSAPNWGTLYRALGLTHSGYGGTAETADALCDFYGPMIDTPDEDMATYCRINAAFEYHRMERRDWLRAALQASNATALDHMRVRMSVNRSATRQQAEFARQYFANNNLRDVALANKYDMWIAPRFGDEFDFVEPGVIENARLYARAELEHDPYNPDLIAALQRQAISITRNGAGGTNTRITGRPTPIQKADYARRLLVSAPYDPDHWVDYAATVGNGHGAEALFMAEPYRINAIVYSNHNIGRVLWYKQTKLRELDLIQRIEAGTLFETGETPQEWLDVQANTDIESVITCPLIRAIRIHSALCDLDANNAGCREPEDERVSYQLVLEQAKTTGQCAQVLGADIGDLIYQPIKVDLGPAPE